MGIFTFPLGNFRKLRQNGAVLAFTVCVATACASLPIVVPPEQNWFLGIDSLLNDAAAPPPATGDLQGPLHVLIVHGGGEPGPYDFEGFIASLASRLRLAQVPPAGASDDQPLGCPAPLNPASSGLVHPPAQYIDRIDGVPHESQARLYTYDFVSAADPVGPKVLTVSYLYWAPLTVTVECKALKEEPGAPASQWFADAAKGFIDFNLGDVDLYGGTYRDRVMRPSVQQALCYFIGGTPGDDGGCGNVRAVGPSVIITHSLGGYMVMDAIEDDLHPGGRARGGLVGREQTAVAVELMANTNFIYMMANQLAYLDLTTLRTYPYPENPGQLLPLLREGEAATGGPGQLLVKFAQDWGTIHPRRPVRAPLGAEVSNPVRQIVAFSDPNDILSWLIQQKNLQLPQSVRLANVYMSNNEFSIPGLFSDPINAHIGYMSNRTVLELLVCGMKDGAPKICLPNGVR